MGDFSFPDIDRRTIATNNDRTWIFLDVMYAIVFFSKQSLH